MYGVGMKKTTLKLWLKLAAIALILGVVLGISGGVFTLWQGAQFEDLKDLEAYKPKLYTKVYDRHGVLLDIISSEKRNVLDFEDIPKDFVNAVVAVEDEYFFDHIGVSPLGIFSAVKDNILYGTMRGASTLTQQLVKNITKDSRASYARKLKEQFLAVQLESRFTKEELFAMYANEVLFGNQQFGIDAAAGFYFGKSVGALNLVECATLAGIPQAPSRLNPFRNPEAVLNKRNIVLARMKVEGYITKEEYQQAMKLPLETVDRKQAKNSPVAGHFIDKVRSYLFDTYGEERVRTSAWDVYTTLDIKYQHIAEKAVRDSLKEVDKKLGYRPYDCPSVFKDKSNPDLEFLKTYYDPSWRTAIQEGTSIRAVVMDVAEDHLMVRIEQKLIRLDHGNLKWVARKIKDMNRYFKVGDVPLFKVMAPEEVPEEIPEPLNEEDRIGEAVDQVPEEESEETAGAEAPKDPPIPVEESFPFRLELDQDPEIEGAFMAVDSSTGDVLAMVGGYDYRRSKFNRAEMAKRQTGSAIKPLVFGAALEQGYTLSDILFDEPTNFWDPTQFYFDEEGELQVRASPEVLRKMKFKIIPTPKPYQPSNYYHKYAGNVTLRSALAQSKNIVSVKLLNSVGYDHVIEYAHRLKVGDDLEPFPSLALGAPEISLNDMVYAYGTFAQGGVRYEPRFILSIMDAKSLPIEKNETKKEQVLSPQNAFLVAHAMKSVVFDDHGTAKRARALGLKHIAGKTGTTNDYTNAWFLGFNTKICAGAWVGRDLNHTIGKNATGGNTALPIWLKFMQGIKEDLTDQKFSLPEGLTVVPIDPYTGKKITSDCDCTDVKPLLEVFIKGTEPTEICSKAERERRKLPWYLQKRTYDFDDESGGVKPAWVRIDNASQLRAKRFIQAQKNKNIN